MIPISISPSLLAGAFSVGSNLDELLSSFAVLAPSERVIHIGTGISQSETLFWQNWPLSEAIVIDAEEQGFGHINAGINPNTKLYKHCAVLAEVAGPTDYFVANNLSENGLVDPTLLRMVWPSLAQSDGYKKDAITLDSLVADKTLQSWLFIDCLPAVRILSGAINTLKHTSIVCVRALAETGFRGEPVGADIKSIDFWLGDQGFKRLAFVNGMNPKIGHAIFGCPTEKRLAPQELSHVKALNHELQAKAAQISKLDEDLSNTAAHRDSLLAQLQTSAEHLQVSEEWSGQLAKQVQARFAEFDQERSRAIQLEAALLERDAALHARAGELEAKVAQIAKLNEDLGNTVAHRDTLSAQLQTSAENLQASEERSRRANEQLQACSAELDQERALTEQLHTTLAERDVALQVRAGELDKKAAQINELNERLVHSSIERDSLVERSRSIQQNLQIAEQTQLSFKSELETEVSRRERLTAENQELIHRQQLMNEELVKAEGQISLIKDLLLREQGL